MNAAIAIDERIRGFHLFEVVARGALATVYRATDGTREVALKVYDEPFDTRAVELAALANVRHAAVARLIETGPLDDKHVIATEWIEGTALSGDVYTWSQIRRIITAIASGLGALHDAGVIHRDLKPSNVILPTAGRPAAAIIDVSHAFAIVPGCAAYTSPEQAQGAPIDSRADFYALGVILYELLCGELPFEGAPEDVLRQHAREPVIAPRKRAPERNIPKVAEDLCMWLLAKDPSARLPNARVLAVTIAATEVSP